MASLVLPFPPSLEENPIALSNEQFELTILYTRIYVKGWTQASDSAFHDYFMESAEINLTY